MKKKIKNLIGIFSLFIIILTTNILFIKTDIVSASEVKDSNLIEKISKDYTKKFCNSIGFGLSKESAMNFSFSENREIFKKRKGIDNIDKELLANKIASSVIDGCGYQLNLYGDKDIEEFANDYLLLEQKN
tara:strand:- start:196 stop:588 length:393 start_codon:yes stop_codon:yes gene_type:complete